MDEVPWAERDVAFGRTLGEPTLLVVADRIRRDGNIHAYEWHTDAANVVTTGPVDGFTIVAPSGATMAGAVSDVHAPRRHVYTLPWDNVTHNAFEWPVPHTIVRSKDDRARRVDLDHLAVMAVTPPGSAPAAIERLLCDGCNLIRITWDGREALVASSAHESGTVTSDRLVTDGDLAKVTVLGDALPQQAISRRCAAPPTTGAPVDGPGCPRAETALTAGSSLTVDGREYVTVRGGAATVVVSGDTVVASGPSGATYRVLAPQAITSVTVDGAEVAFTRDGEYVTFGSAV